MSNLGGYQVMTSVAKKVGGPKGFVGILLGTGVILGGGALKIGETTIEKINMKRKTKKRYEESLVTYEVYKEGKSNEGLLFCVGDKYKILEKDGNAVLIEKVGDSNNPYFVAKDFLEEISNYKE